MATRSVEIPLPVGRAISNREESGQSLIETAIIMPLIIILLAGVFDFGRVIHAYVVVVNAARETAIAGAAAQMSESALNAVIADELQRGGVNSGTATATFVYGTIGSPAVQTLTVDLAYEVPMVITSLVFPTVTVRTQSQIPTFW